jgi:hypothetical protein
MEDDKEGDESSDSFLPCKYRENWFSEIPRKQTPWPTISMLSFSR